jgi:hypothetical protein
MANNIQLINCSGVIVKGDVERFIALGVDGLEVDNTYNNTIIIGHVMGALRPNVSAVTTDFTIDGKYQIYEIDLDTTGIDITCTWDAVAYPYQITFKIVSNTSALDFIINGGAATIDGYATPFTTGLITWESLTIYSNGTNLRII